MDENAHRQALERGLAPLERISKISHLSWRVYVVPDGKLILPDCVVLAKERRADSLHPYAISEINEPDEILFPVSPNKLVVGSVTHDVKPNAHQFNEMAAACCSTFFVAANASNENDDLRRRIGTYVETAIIPLASETIKELSETLPRKSALPPESGASSESPPHPLSIPVTFPLGTEPERAKVIAESICAIAIEVSKAFPLNNLHSITFVQVGEDSEESTSVASKGITVARAGDDVLPHLIDNDPDKGLRVLLHMETGEALFSFQQDDSASSSALYVSMFQLFFAGHREKIYKAFRERNVVAHPDPWNNALLSIVERSLGAYMSAFYCGPIVPDADALLAEQLCSTISLTKSRIAGEKVLFQTHKNLDNFALAALGDVGAILWYVSKLLGHHHGTDRQALHGQSTLRTLLAELDLLHWIRIFETDLEKARQLHGGLESIEDLLPLGIHVERLLWPFGVFSWRDELGATQVYFRY